MKLSTIAKDVKNKRKRRILKKFDNMKNLMEGDGYPYVIQTDDESMDDGRFGNAKNFMDFIMGKLGIKSPVKVTMTGDRKHHGLKTLAHFNNADSHCVAYSKGRNMADVLRSIAHELVHKSQFENGKIKDEPVQDIGGPIEDEANAVAGQLVKEFGYKNPEIFE